LPRIIPTVLTMSDMRAICNNPSPNVYAIGGAISASRPRFTQKLQGRQLCFAMDNGEKWQYNFETDGLSLSIDGQTCRKEYAQCLESAVSGVYLIHHLHTGVVPCSATTTVFDERESLVTLVSDTFATVHANRDVCRKVSFGALEGAPVKERHAVTDKMTGRVIDWKYANDIIIHQLYENKSCCAFVSPPPSSAPDWSVFFTTFNPTKYIRIRENLYLLSFYAPGSSGMEVSMLMDLDSMTQIGAAFGIDTTDTLRSYTFGAKGAWAEVAFIGRYTVE
jgi:hypothetical protein